MGIVKKFKIKSFKKLNTVIQLDKVSLFYGKRQVLENINLKINQSEIFGVLGPNGSGKTTIMNLVVGIVRPSSGRILINGEDVTSMPIYERVKRHRMTVIPQRSGVFWELTCKECLLAIGELHIPDKKERIQMAETLISKFSLESVENLECKLMSGGQVRKTAIAMSLMSKPEIILLDEPFSALDPKSVEDLQNTIANLQLEDSRRAFIITDHAYRELIQISDKLGLLADKHFVQQGPVREVIEDEVSRKVYFSSSFTNK